LEAGTQPIGLTERLPLESDRLFEEMSAVVGDRTLEIVERRRKTARVRRRGWLIRRMLLLADVAGLCIAFAVAQRLFGPSAGGATGELTSQTEALLFAATLPLWIVVAKLYGLYDHDEERTDHSTSDDIAGVFHLVTVGACIVFVGGRITGLIHPELGKVLVFWLVAIATIIIGRGIARACCRRSITYLQNTVIVGAGDVGQTVARKCLQHPEYGINLVGFVDSEPLERAPGLEHLCLLGPTSSLTAIVRAFDVERVVIAFSKESHEQTLNLIRSLKDLEVQVDIIPRLFEIVGSGIEIHAVEGLPLVGLRPLRLSRSSRMLKRTMDLSFSALGLVILSPLFLAAAVAIKLDSPGPVFFRQVRMGAGDRPFRIFKFRTMVADAELQKGEMAELNMHARNGDDPTMFKMPDDPRVTRVGQVLRRYSIDELPQLLNVLIGEMSLVGPRPLILDEDERVVEWARKRLALKPGATGLWQVLGASDIPFNEMTKLDYIYVTNWSLWGDVMLMFRTLPAILRTRRAY
jgi:exopolysaccharide biosynthesis polyprenyl glycosylphosphotransferase